MEYFNKILIHGYSDQEKYRKLIYQDLKNIQICKNIINEDVYFNKDFFDLYTYIKINEKYIFLDTNKLLEYFPYKSKIFKIISKKSKRNYKQLYIIKTDGSEEDIIEILKNIVITKLKDKIEQEKEVIDSLVFQMKKVDALFITLDINDFGIMLLKNTFKLNDFKHEFIHYLEWLNGIYADKIKYLKDDFYFEEEIYFKEMFNINSDILEYIFNKNEYETLLNDLLNLLEKIKKKYFFGLSNKEYCDKIIYMLFKDNQDNLDYLNKIENLNIFNLLKTNYSFMFLIGYNCINYKLTNIKNHIYGYFLKK